MHSDVYESIWFKLAKMIVLLNSVFYASLIDYHLHSRSQNCESTNSSATMISQSSLLIWIEIGMVLRLVGVMSLMLLLSCPFTVQRREPYLCGFKGANSADRIF